MAYSDELDQIRDDARTSRVLRDGVPGQQAGMDDLRVRLNGGDPAAGSALRNQPPADMSELRDRITRAVPPRNVPVNPGVYTAGPEGVSTAAPPERTLREKISYTNPQMEAEQQAVRQRLTPTAPAATPAAAPAVAAEAPAGRAYGMGRTVGNIARRAGPIAAGADAIAGMGTYQINDPAVDSSAGGTIRAVANGDLAGAGRSISKGALETAMDLGGSAAGVADAVLPGQPVTKAYNGFLKNQFGDQLQVNNVGALRSALGLHPAPPAERVTLTPDAQRRVAAGETAKAPSTTLQPPLKVASPQPSTISGVGAQASKTPAVDYRLGENAVEVLQDGDSHVQLFGPNGERAAVPSNVFYGGPQSIAQYADSVRAAQSRALEDPSGALAKTRLENEGHLAVAKETGQSHVAAAKEAMKAPVRITDNMGNTTSVFTGTPEGGGNFHTPPVQLPRPASVQKAHSYAKEAVDKGWSTPDQVNQQLSQWQYPPLTFKSK